MAFFLSVLFFTLFSAESWIVYFFDFVVTVFVARPSPLFLFSRCTGCYQISVPVSNSGVSDECNLAFLPFFLQPK